MHVDRTKGWTAFVAATLLTGSCVAPRTAESGALESLSGDAESMVMLRLEASVDGKARNPLDPLSGFKLLLAPLDGVDTPPRVQKLLSPTRQSRNEGWIHFTLPPGDYFLLAVPPGRDQNPPAVVYHLDSALLRNCDEHLAHATESVLEQGSSGVRRRRQAPARF